MLAHEKAKIEVATPGYLTSSQVVITGVLVFLVIKFSGRVSVRKKKAVHAARKPTAPLIAVGRIYGQS
jgi:hypothetical protein